MVAFIYLNHALQQSIDELLSVTSITSLNKVSAFVMESTSRVVQFEGPQETVGFCKVWTSSVDLVNEVLCADDIVFAKSLLDLSVVQERDALALYLQESTLVHELLDGLKGGVSPCNVGLDKFEH